MRQKNIVVICSPKKERDQHAAKSAERLIIFPASNFFISSRFFLARSMTASLTVSSLIARELLSLNPFLAWFVNDRMELLTNNSNETAFSTTMSTASSITGDSFIYSAIFGCFSSSTFFLFFSFNLCSYSVEIPEWFLFKWRFNVVVDIPEF